jgi:hypothetical protein
VTSEQDRGSISVLVSAACFADAEEALLIVRKYFRSPTIKIGGLLVENADLKELRVAPNHLVISTSGSFLVPPQSHQANTLLAADAHAFETTLIAMTQNRDNHWSFTRKKGDLLAETSELSSNWDILIFGQSRLHRLKGSVVFAHEGSNEDRLKIQTAEELAAVLDTKLKLFSRGNQRSTSNTETVFRDIETLLREVSKTNAQAVVVTSDLLENWTNNQIRTLLDCARCPLIVLGKRIGAKTLEHSVIFSKD